MSEFSIIIPLYNKEKDILDTLKSVLNQSHTDFEIIIVNDGSTDDSERVIKTLVDERIKYFSKQNEGVALTRNYGVNKAKYEHVVFLDADDHWHLDFVWLHDVLAAGDTGCGAKHCRPAGQPLDHPGCHQLALAGGGLLFAASCDHFDDHADSDAGDYLSRL